MFVRYSQPNQYFEYDTSPGQTGAGPWVMLPIKYVQIVDPPSIPAPTPPYVLPATVAHTDRYNRFLTTQAIYANGIAELDLQDTAYGLSYRLIAYQNQFQIYYNPIGGIFRMDSAGNCWVHAQVQGQTLRSLGNTHTGGNHHTAGQIYPGRVDVAAQEQSSYYLATHAGYGLYSNSGMFLAGGLVPAGGMDPNYLLRETPISNFTPDSGGTFNVVSQYGAMYTRHNSLLTVMWMLDVDLVTGAASFRMRIPGGFTNAGGYTQTTGLVMQSGGNVDVRLEVAPGDVWIYCYSSSGGGMGFGARFSGQIMIYVG